MRIIKLLLLAIILGITSAANAQGGWKLRKIDNFESKFVTSRNVEIWLPQQYFESEDKKFPVLYMHDGQNVFDPVTSSFGTAWEADATAEKMINEGKVKPFIIVTSWCTDKRYAEYFPEKAAKYFTKEDLDNIAKSKQQTGPLDEELLGDEYLKFLTSELKPYVDENFRTLTDAKNTSICGSSMGGLISLYAICEYPEVFGPAACVSTHWPLLFDNTFMGPSEAVRKYMAAKLPSPANHRIYFDYGTETLDQYYEVHQKKVDAIMASKGYKKGKNWVTRKFEGAEHSEKSWQLRMDVIFSFLYGK